MPGLRPHGAASAALADRRAARGVVAAEVVYRAVLGHRCDGVETPPRVVLNALRLAGRLAARTGGLAGASLAHGIREDLEDLRLDAGLARVAWQQLVDGA